MLFDSLLCLDRIDRARTAEGMIGCLDVSFLTPIAGSGLGSGLVFSIRLAPFDLVVAPSANTHVGTC